MNKNAVKEYAIWARRELIDRVSQKAFEYGIERDHIESVSGDVVKGIVLTSEQKVQRQALVTAINTKGFDQVMEEAAYTWFNRFIALRFMEVNSYLPQKIRPFTDEENKFNPQLITDALDLDFVDKNTIYSYKDKNDTDGLYKYLLISLCNDMNQYLPGMFTRIDNYTTLLFPDNLLREGSVVSRLISDIDEDSWNDQVQIIGWLYQFYNQNPKDELIHAKKQYQKNHLPYVTQLFTSDWIVRFMVDNSLGKYWIERNPDTEVINNLEFYVKARDGKINCINDRISPEELTFIDPCMGSGHILVYAFDVLMQIYESQGYTQRDAASLILKNNIYGLDIDERAYQLSYFALMMKARQYSRRIFNEHIELNVMDIKESNGINYKTLDKFKELKSLATKLVDLFKDAKEYGSILIVDFTAQQLDQLENRLEEIYSNIGDGGLFDTQDTEDLYTLMKPLIKQARIMSQKYDTVVTNPPYLNSSSMPSELKTFAAALYKDFKSDLFACFVKRAVDICKDNGYIGMLTPYVWWFISSYEKMRLYVINSTNIDSLVQLEYNAFEAACVPVGAFSLKKTQERYSGEYIKLSKFKGIENQEPKCLEAIRNKESNFRYSFDQTNFRKIPGSPIAYWVSEALLKDFVDGKQLDNYADPRQGLATTDNNKFLRLWSEVLIEKINFTSRNKDEAEKSGYKWFPYNKGGDFRKWYGNNDYIVNYEKDGQEIKRSVLRKYTYLKTPDFVVKNTDFYFKECASWSLISSSATAFRYKQPGFIFDVSGMSFFANKNLYYYLGFCNTKIAYEILNIIAPTINFQAGDIAKLPIIERDDQEATVSSFVKNCISLSKSDWDSFETSWDFEEHPLLKNKVDTIKKAYTLWDSECNDRFNTLKNNEEELNRIFIDIYGLNDELTPEVEDKDVTVRKADLTRDIKSLISYAVGCMFGRYSLDTRGLAYAGGEWDNSKYSSFIPDTDNIIPISDDEFFEDDITARFINFIETAYGKETLEENLQFIADALGGKGTSRQIIRNYFVSQFFTDHCNTYQVTGSGKRPIYWLFDSGKKNGFKALIYMHRYTPDLLAKMRTDYVHEQQERYRTQIENLESEVLHLSGSEKIKAEKILAKYKDQLTETSKFEEKLHHLADKMISIDLDDGFKQNYPKFEDVVAKVK